MKEEQTTKIATDSEVLHPISKLIRKRTSTYADAYGNQKIPKSTIKEIVTNALWAPTHKMTEPWRFEVLEGAHKEDLGKYMLAYYQEKFSTEQFPESRYQETQEYPKNATLIAIIFQRSKRIRLPEWEEIAAISCAVQNMWLSCSEMGLGGYWDTGGATIAYCEESLELQDHEKCFGIFYMGIPKQSEITKNRARKSIDNKLTWNRK